MSLKTALSNSARSLKSARSAPATNNLVASKSSSSIHFQSNSSTTSSNFNSSPSRLYATVSSNLPPTNSPNQNNDKDDNEKALTWQQYLKLRAKRRTYGLATTVPTTALSAALAGSYFLSLEIDPSSPILGLDPLLVYGVATLSCTGLGWLLGPSLGNALFNLSHKSISEQLSLKDSDFHERIKKWRPNPQQLPPTVQNRLPDYYAEKVGSIKDYRKWLREQAEFKRRARHGVKETEGEE